MLRKLVFLLIAAYYLFLSPRFIFAQTPTQEVVQAPRSGINLTISPIFLNLTTDPGKPVTSQLKITNNNNEKEYLQIDIAKFEPERGGDTPKILDITPEDEFKNWISFSEQKFSVEPNQTKTIRFTISPDSRAAFGYYYALVVNRVNQAENEKGTTAVTGAPAFLVLLEVRSPNAKRELQLVDFTTNSLWYEYLPAEFRVTVKNTGNVHVIPSGDIFIDAGDKRDVGIVRANQSRGNILPNSERTYKTTWDDSFITTVQKTENGKLVVDKNSNPVYETHWDFGKADKFRIGKYTAHLLMVYDNGHRDVPIEATVSFWVIPWKIIGLGLIILYFVYRGIRSTVGPLLKKIKRFFVKK